MVGRPRAPAADVPPVQLRVMTMRAAGGRGGRQVCMGAGRRLKNEEDELNKTHHPPQDADFLRGSFFDWLDLLSPLPHRIGPAQPLALSLIPHIELRAWSSSAIIAGSAAHHSRARASAVRPVVVRRDNRQMLDCVGSRDTVAPVCLRPFSASVCTYNSKAAALPASSPPRRPPPLSCHCHCTTGGGGLACLCTFLPASVI